METTRDPYEPAPAKLTPEGLMLLELREIRKEMARLTELTQLFLVSVSNLASNRKAPAKKAKRPSSG